MERKARYCESVQFIRQKQNLNFVGAILLISLLVFVVFFPSLTNDFQRAWDDQWMVLAHTMITDQSMDNLWYYFTHYDRGQYFPLNQLYYIGIYNLFGLNASAFHAGSLILHLVNVIMVFLFLHQLVKLTNRRTGSPNPESRTKRKPMKNKYSHFDHIQPPDHFHQKGSPEEYQYSDQDFEPGVVSVIVPCYNEEDNIRVFLKELSKVDVTPYKKEIIIINDGSEDGSAAILTQLKIKN